MMIMAHNMIPHNHHDSDHFLMPGHSHTATGMSNEYHSHGDDHDACHISGLLFHQLAQDHLILERNTNVLSGPALLAGLISGENNRFFYHNPFYNSVSLRAPPAA